MAAMSLSAQWPELGLSCCPTTPCPWYLVPAAVVLSSHFPEITLPGSSFLSC